MFLSVKSDSFRFQSTQGLKGLTQLFYFEELFFMCRLGLVSFYSENGSHCVGIVTYGELCTKHQKNTRRTRLI